MKKGKIMFEFKMFLQEYKKNKEKYNTKFKVGLFLISLIYGIGYSYFTYNWKINTFYMIIIIAYTTVWDALHSRDDDSI